MKIITEQTRLLLRELEPGDAPALHPVFSDPQATRFMRTHSDSSETLAWIEAIRIGYKKYGFGPWAVVRKKDNALLGYCGCSILHLHGKEEYEIAYRIVPAYWGQGFATEAVLACIDYAFTNLSFSRLFALIQPENIASVRVTEKTGMKHRCDTIYEGIPMRLYEINADDKGEQNNHILRTEPQTHSDSGKD